MPASHLLDQTIVHGVVVHSRSEELGAFDQTTGQDDKANGRAARHCPTGLEFTGKAAVEGVELGADKRVDGLWNAR